MNTYNENLRSAIASSLQSQNLNQKNLNSKLTASLFTLYHSEGATITAHEKLEQAQTDLDFKAKVKKLAVANSNISNNELVSATQANNFVKQSVSNTAVCAANIQIAATAVVKLASDMGSIFSIINAADSGSDIYIQAREAYEKINDTAYHAEFLSQLAMETSMQIAEVSSSTVLDQSKLTNTTMGALLKIASDEFTSSSTIVSDDNSAVASASASEKIAEGNFKYLSVDYTAANNAYISLNYELNLGLVATVSADKDSIFNVDFKSITRPFDDAPVPVDSYCMFVVKDTLSTIFSASNAENIIDNYANKPRFAKFPAHKNEIHPVDVTGIDIKTDLKTGHVGIKVNFLKDQTNVNPLLDTDGDPITTGQNYVAFIMAIYTEEYKKKVNDFSDYLSAPSPVFCVTYHLKPAQNIKWEAIDSGNTSKEDAEYQDVFNQQLNAVTGGLHAVSDDTDTNDDYSYKISFSVKEPLDFVGYRCILLPANHDITQGMLTQESLDIFSHEIKSLEIISNEYDPKIAEIQSQIYEVELEQQATPPPAKGAAPNTDLSAKLQSLTAQLQKLVDKKELLIQSISNKGKKEKIRFFFNEVLAEQVAAGNYLPAVNIDKIKGTATSQAKGTKQVVEANPTTNWVAYIGPGTTDNFGNLLTDAHKYIPVILSISNAAENNLSKYSNTLTDIDAPAFEYKSNVKL